MVFSIYVPLMFINPIMFCDLRKNLNSNGFSLRCDFLYVSVSYFCYVCLDLCLYNLFTFYIMFSIGRNKIKFFKENGFCFLLPCPTSPALKPAAYSPVHPKLSYCSNCTTQAPCTYFVCLQVATDCYRFFLNFILVKNSTCFGQTYCPSSGVLTL